MANVAANSWRLYVTIVTAYAMTLGTLALMLKEWKLYVQRRHEFLLRPNAHQYSVLIDDLPHHLRTNATLTRYLQYLFPNAVHSVTMMLELSDLANEVEERRQVRTKLEHAMTLSSQTGCPPPRHKVGGSGCFGGRPVDSIDLPH